MCLGGVLSKFRWFLLFAFFAMGIGDVRKCTDEEHITYSGGSKIKDLAQCGWGERKMKNKKYKKREKKCYKYKSYNKWNIEINENIIK